MKRNNFLLTVLGFIWKRKAYWLLPAIVALLIVILLIATASSPVAPFVYSII